MQAYAQYLPDKMIKRDVCGVMSGSMSAGVCIFCCRTAAISAPFTPLSTFRFQPLPAVAFLAIDVDITFHYVTSQFSAFGRLGVAWRSLVFLGIACRPRRFSAISMVGNLDVHRSQHCLQHRSQVTRCW